MRIRIWPFISGSFCMLLLLVPLFAWIVSRKVAGIEIQAREGRLLFHRADEAIAAIRTEVYGAALLVRQPASIQERSAISQQLKTMRLRTDAQLNEIETGLGSAQARHVPELRQSLDSFWNAAMDDEKRDALLGVAEQIDAFNNANVRIAEEQIDVQQGTVWRFVAGAAFTLLALGIVIAAASIWYLAHIEASWESERRRAEGAENELRRLSNQLVRAQEEERKTISRELHDEVGQMLTGLRMELGGLWRGEADGGFSERLNSVKALAEDALRSVRNLSLLLRPSMLDDLGLAPALRWHAKEFSRRTGIEVSIDIRGTLADLPETFRICLYRAIQEALTNCAKHASASAVTVRIERDIGSVSAYVTDNGTGFHAASPRTQGLGLVGMDERVRALNGKLTISSVANAGTTIAIHLPVAADKTGAIVPAAAGI